jgi:hypothetical protein
MAAEAKYRSATMSAGTHTKNLRTFMSFKSFPALIPLLMVNSPTLICSRLAIEFSSVRK